MRKVLINEPDNKSVNKILATIDNNDFNHKNKTSKLKFNEINGLINSIKGNKYYWWIRC